MPPEYLKQLLEEDDSLPVPDAVFGLADTEGEGSTTVPTVDELLEDPNVKAAFEAAQGLEPVAS